MEGVSQCLKNLHRFQNRSCFTTWVFQYCFYSYLDMVRKQKRQRSLCERLQWERAEAHDMGRDPLVCLMQLERHIAIRRAMERLPDSYRVLLSMVVLEEISFRAVAQRLQLSRKETVLQYNYALRLLKSYLFTIIALRHVSSRGAVRATDGRKGGKRHAAAF